MTYFEADGNIFIFIFIALHPLMHDVSNEKCEWKASHWTDQSHSKCLLCLLANL